MKVDSAEATENPQAKNEMSLESSEGDHTQDMMIYGLVRMTNKTFWKKKLDGMGMVGMVEWM